MEPRCLSYNLGPHMPYGHECEISNSDHVQHAQDLVSRPGYTYIGTENGCSSSPCLNNATCLSLSPTTFQCQCSSGFTGINCETGKSCRDIKTASPHAPNGMYRVHPEGGRRSIWVYCDMTSFGGGWTMCYSTNNKVHLRKEVTYNESLPYGTNGYRTDCNHIQFREILFVDELEGDHAFFTHQSGSSLVMAGNYQKQFPGFWKAGGVADTRYHYQLLICNTKFYSGFLLTGNFYVCRIRCTYWCSDKISPFFRTAANSSVFTGVAFNINGHRSLKSRLISVGLR
ncbi:uncharacterized protein LOC111341593 [Stylophora pistillata]|uniref:uncharacterized protein LOC111341593 n=1 Tax=Stylophora pistillata TaxID=50429 RepID=UPI000C038EF6|nr:uncharacterized protein LOC111341593 [Stylophora pistillata]